MLHQGSPQATKYLFITPYFLKCYGHWDSPYYYKRLVEEQGGKTSESISKKVDYVVVGANPGSKLQQAKSFPPEADLPMAQGSKKKTASEGIKVLTEEEFLRL